MNKRNIAIATCIAALLGTGAVVAGGAYCENGKDGHSYHRGHHGHGHGGMYGKHMVSHLEDRLDLSQAQSEALEDLFRARKESRDLHHDSRRDLISRAVKLDPEAQNYDTEVAKLADEVAEIARQRALEMAGMQKEISALLSPEQRTELRELIQKRMSGKMKRFGESDNS
jgi:Spy/CpxP family protein refolding chaperone